MEILRLRPSAKRPIWGGNKIAFPYKGLSGSVGETWELSFLAEGPCFVAGGEFDGRPLAEVAGPLEIGRVPSRFDEFPTLVKFIDAAADLSVQVHPSDELAARLGVGRGKTEAWYVLDADEGAGIFLGFKRGTSADEVRRAALDGSIAEMLRFVPVSPGECYFVPAGTVHAIGAGVTVFEVQESSAVTYRVYDYDRLGADGKPRQLHLDEALASLDFRAYSPPVPDFGVCSIEAFGGRTVPRAKCGYFSLYEAGEGEYLSADSFVLAAATKDGKLDGLEARRGECFFIPAGRRFRLAAGEWLLVCVEE